VPVSDFFWGSFNKRWRKELGLPDDANPYYFKDNYQGMPKNGFTVIFEKMLDHTNIEILLNKDFFEIKKDINFDNIIYFK
jgi:UDP-galactopyranose mutase